MKLGVYPLLIFILIQTVQCFAQQEDLRSLYIGARARAMGNAFTAVADDDQAIFLNPAGLGGNQEYSFKYLDLDLQLSKDIYNTYKDSSSALSSFSTETINAVMGKNIFARAQYTSTLLAGNLGVAFIVDWQAAILAQNPVLPNIQLALQGTNGVQIAYGFSLNGLRRRASKKHDLRLGFGAKMLSRKGGYRKYELIDLATFDEAEFTSSLGDYGKGYSTDLGMQYIYKMNNKVQAMAGATLLNAGDIAFRGSGSGSNRPEPLQQDLRAGIALRYEDRAMKYTLSADLHQLLEATDWRKRMHLGFEAKLPLFALYGGLNQIHPTYGVTTDLWLIKITFLSFEEDFGTVVRQNPVRTFQLNLSMKLNI